MAAPTDKDIGKVVLVWDENIDNAKAKKLGCIANDLYRDENGLWWLNARLPESEIDLLRLKILRLEEYVAGMQRQIEDLFSRAV